MSAKFSGRATLLAIFLFLVAVSFGVRTVFHKRRAVYVRDFLEECCKGTEALGKLDREPTLLDIADDEGWDCLINASKFNRLDLVKALLLRGASTGGPLMKHSALRGAALSGYNDVVRALIEAGADVDVFSSHKRTPLMGAAMNGHSTVVKSLLRAGADTDIKNDDGMTARDLALRNAHNEIVLMLDRFNNKKKTSAGE